MSSSNLTALVTGLPPVLLILLLGFAAAEHRSSDPDQTSCGFSCLVMDYTVPASPFIAIIKTPRSARVHHSQPLPIVALAFGVVVAVGYVVARILADSVVP